MDLGPFQPLLAGLLKVSFLIAAAEFGLIWLRSAPRSRGGIESSGYDS